MATNRMAYDALQTAMARQRVTVYDLYGLLGISPNVDEAGIRRAYEEIVRKLHPEVPSNVINVAYSILVNPFKRAQYDRDRLEYLYTHFNAHESFPATTTNLPTRSLTSRDEQIQVYATTLVDRVKDPIEEKKKAIIRRIATIRNEVDEFNELSLKQRQDWATSTNRVLRMAGNALCEVVVCAEEDLRMLEDELGRVDGVLEPKDKDGPAGRVTSGPYGSDISAMIMLNGKPSVLMNQRVPSVPRSPTVPIHPKSASKLGVQAQDISGKNKDDTPSSEASEAVTEIRGGDRVDAFLLGPNHIRRQPKKTINADNVASNTVKKPQTPRARMSSLLEAITKANNQASLNDDFSSMGRPMGLVDYQRLHGLHTVDESRQDEPVWAAPETFQRHSINNQDDIRMGQPPISASGSWRHSWDPSYIQGTTAPTDSFGFHVSQPTARGSATASNTALFKEETSGQGMKGDSSDPFA
ncbi:Chaperone protein DnaJ [Cytospora mali]|uniref:Chaperone protein DnaJ n=1 Tax=Cytospora mali TaxID=578113 RepID=A0A194V322_CYTMA|nr:Chaperone protein DnaJ [Valsa mali var. pyri (nom. inval.)]